MGKPTWQDAFEVWRGCKHMSHTLTLRESADLGAKIGEEFGSGRVVYCQNAEQWIDGYLTACARYAAPASKAPRRKSNGSKK